MVSLVKFCVPPAKCSHLVQKGLVLPRPLQFYVPLIVNPE